MKIFLLAFTGLIVGSSATPLVAKEIEVYIQENCQACLVQAKEFDCLKDLAWKLKLIGVGVRTNKLEFYTRKIAKELPFEFLSWEEARQIGASGTPFLIVKDSSRVRKLLGSKSCTEISKWN